MNCNLPAPRLDCCGPTPQEMLTDLLQVLKGIERKAIKGLIKQYEVDSIRQDAPDYSDDTMVREKPIIITYFNQDCPRIKFEWPIHLYKYYD